MAAASGPWPSAPASAGRAVSRKSASETPPLKSPGSVTTRGLRVRRTWPLRRSLASLLTSTSTPEAR